MKNILFSTLVMISTVTLANDVGDSFDQRIAQIRTELTDVKQHPWAGEYSSGGTFYSLTLWISPRSGAVFQSSGCMHRDRCQGDVKTLDGAIFIDWEQNDVDEPFVCNDKYLPVRYGRFSAIIPFGRLHSFCIAASHNGSIPSSDTLHMLWRDTGQLSESKGLTIPVKYEYLLQLPSISGTITSVGEPERKQETNQYHSLTQQLELDIGTDDHVAVGMEFELTRRGLSHQNVIITSVTSTASTGVMSARAKVGQRLAPARRTWSVRTATW